MCIRDSTGGDPKIAQITGIGNTYLHTDVYKRQALTGMLQQMFNAADVAVVGRFAGKNAMAAVGSNSSIVGLLINLFVGLATGVNVVIAQSTGEKNFKRIGKEVHTSIILAVTGGVSLLIIGELIAEPLLIWTSIPVEIFDMALLYLSLIHI